MSRLFQALQHLPWTRALVHPLPSRRFPRVFRAVMSIWRPPNKRTKRSSPCVAGHLHWMCLAYRVQRLVHCDDWDVTTIQDIHRPLYDIRGVPNHSHGLRLVIEERIHWQPFCKMAVISALGQIRDVPISKKNFLCVYCNSLPNVMLLS